MRDKATLRFIALVLSVVLVLQASPLQALAVTAEVSETTGVRTERNTYPGEESTVISAEMYENREETVKHFRLEDGSYIAVDYGMPVHYAENGNWVDIDNTLILQGGDNAQMASTGGHTVSGYAAENGDHLSVFADTLASGFLFASGNEQGSVQMLLVDNNTGNLENGTVTMSSGELSTGFSQTYDVAFNQNTQAQISYPNQASVDQEAYATAYASTTGEDTENEDQTPSIMEQVILPNLRADVLYEDVFDGVDLLYELFSFHIKESIVVKEQLDTYSFSFLLNLNGLIPEMQEDGSIYLSNDEDEAVYWIPAPYMTDASENYSEAVYYTLVQNSDGTWLLTVTADENWINEEGRSFPVIIDPTLIDLTSWSDFVGETVNEEDNNVTTKTNVACGYHPTHGKMEVYFRFDLPEIPEGATMVRAQVALDHCDFVPTTSTASLILYMSMITEAVTIDENLTWANRPDIGTYLDYAVVSYDTLQDMICWDVTEAAKTWYEDATKNYGLAMTSNASSSMQYRAWFDCEINSAFIVSYRNTNGIEPYYTYRTLGTGHGGTTYISDYTGQLTQSKALASYASTTNPFTLELIYNSSYWANGRTDAYDVAEEMGMGMHLGSGVHLNVMQRIMPVQVLNDIETEGYTTYLKYTDGDGTDHYFAQKTGDTEYYYDEDGLGLKIKIDTERGLTATSLNDYTMSDDKDNEMVFRNGLLTCIRDSNDNEIQIQYATSDGVPTGSGDRIRQIFQKNNGVNAIEIMTLGYDDSYYLTTVADAAGIITELGYTDGKLTSVKKNNVLLASYAYSEYQLTSVYDAEAQYGIKFEYTSRKISKYYEVLTQGAAAPDGAVVAVSHENPGQTMYRNYGADRVENENDILTYYTFDYAGRSVNAYTTDTDNKILGASNAVYSGMGTTDKANNRTLATSTIGIGAEKYFTGGGFESSDGWTISSGTRATSGARTGNGVLTTGSTSRALSASKATRKLYAGETYTLSGYVKTSESSATAPNVYLALKSGTTIVARTEKVNYKTSSDLDNGWVRVSCTYKPTTTGVYTVAVSSGAGTNILVDDIQLEQGDAPASVNLLDNGDFQDGISGWTPATRVISTAEGMPYGYEGSLSCIRLDSAPTDGTYAVAEVILNQPGTQTYVLSGWAKGDAVPNGASTGSHDRAFCIRAKITYSDNSTEYQQANFNPDVSEWQFTSTVIVPNPEKTVTKIQVVCGYERNANSAYFDNLSLTREPAQTMDYDENGNLKSVTATGLTEETASYDGGDLIGQVTGGSGYFAYEYDARHNVTQVVSKENENASADLTQTNTYDGFGNTTTTTLRGTGNLYMETTAEYTADGNRLVKVTDGSGVWVEYGYGTGENMTASDMVAVMTGQPVVVTSANGSTSQSSYDAFGRTVQNEVANAGSLVYTYTKGNLTNVNRTTSNGTQIYSLSYDNFGNTTEIKVGNTVLASYTYYPQNGNLRVQTYGNGDTITYTYDKLDRIIKTEYSSGRVLTYTYNGDGQLYRMTDNNGTAATSDDVVYLYNYDSLKRLISSEQKKGTATELRTSQVYNANNQLTKQSWELSGTAYAEEYTYDWRGLLTELQSASGSTLTLEYDELRRLDTVTAGTVYSRNYDYIANGDKTTNQIGTVTYSGKVSEEYVYTYNDAGYIASETVNGVTYEYTYDTQGQLLEVTVDGVDIYEYTYDSAGNILTANNASYGYDTGEWKDLLRTYKGQTIVYQGESATTNTDGTVTVTGIPTSGNPISYFNGTHWGFTWAEGRNLNTAATSTATKDTDLSFTYDSNGLRTSKTVVVNHYDPNHVHSYTTTRIDATCTEQGYELHECACGDSYMDSYTFPLGHNFRNGLTVTLYCTRCGASSGGGIVPIDPIFPINPTTQEEVETAEITSTDRVLVSSSTVEHKYTYASGRLLRETYGSTTLDFFYDANGAPYAMKYNGTMYYYILNLQGDVMHLVNTSGTIVASYTYDPWGKVEVSPSGSVVGNANPLRYRGYYYDAESGLYYLQSRYYDPAIGRFINADLYVSTGQEFLGYNMFAYCNNSPVNHVDAMGSISTMAIKCLISVATSIVCGLATGDSLGEIVVSALIALGGTVIEPIGMVFAVFGIIQSVFEVTQATDDLFMGLLIGAIGVFALWFTGDTVGEFPFIENWDEAAGLFHDATTGFICNFLFDYSTYEYTDLYSESQSPQSNAQVGAGAHYSSVSKGSVFSTMISIA